METTPGLTVSQAAKVAYTRYVAYVDRGSQDDLLEAWRTGVRLVEIYVRRRRAGTSAHDQEELVVNMSFSLWRALSREKIPAANGVRGFKAYVTTCFGSWMADALRELGRGRAVPHEYRPPEVSWGQPWHTECALFVEDLKQVAPKRILAGCRFGASFRAAAEHVIQELCDAREPSRMEVRRRWTQGRTSFVIQWCRMQLRHYLEPVRHYLAKNEDATLRTIYDDQHYHRDRG